ncbi:TraL conjugative transposon family protein [Parabacteroides faecis]|uniref:TraL conjugative transposon family protein n=1 Tax=Parabacteroides faecis TaxID=1217282 RepID=UPI0021643B2C|nr:TraL conjugative transposon family protein [Parabacteroides faecis]MCS2889907.1 TraL conjugative transposon family protein [Parabacteroides faecis]UVQ46394.1 TraL conjugative transposon family protein [Parabacteroides faecis]
MGKWIERVRDWTDRQDGRLRAWLEALPQRTRLAAVLVIFTVFAVCALFTFGAALYEMGRENGRRIEIEHIRELDLRQRQDSINLYKYYDYGTEQESDGLPESGEA